MSQLWEGYRLGGRYELQEKIGEGGMSVVYKAFDHNLKRVVAIKIIHPHLAHEPDFMRRFQTEAQAVAQLKHPNIVQVYDFAHEGELYYMVLEFIAGESLQQVLNMMREIGQRLNWHEAVRIIVRLADAVAYAHAHGVVHRDIKPANILLTPQGEPILTDFGLARMMQASRHTRTGTILGTMLYMAPEQVRGETVDERVDIYALGAVLFELLTGHPPFPGDNLAEIMRQHLEAPIPDPRTEVPELPPALSAVVMKALAKTPQARFASAHELKAALEAVLAEAQPPREPSPPVTRTVVEAPTDAPPGAATLVEPATSPAGPSLPARPVSSQVEPDSPRQPDRSGPASIGDVVKEAQRERPAITLAPLAALESALLGGLFLYLALLWQQPWGITIAGAWWALALGILGRYGPRWWRLSRTYRLALLPRDERSARHSTTAHVGAPPLPNRFRTPRLDFPHDMSLMAFPAALAAVMAVGVALLMTVMPQTQWPLLAQGWLILASLTLWFHLRFMALAFLQPGLLDRLHFGHFFLSLAFGFIAIPGMALAPLLSSPWHEIVLIVALGAFGLGGMLGALTLIFLLRRALSIGLPPPTLAPLVFVSSPLIAVYTLLTLLLFRYLKTYGLPIPQVVLRSTTLMAWGIWFGTTALAAMVYQGYRRAGIPRTALRWALLDMVIGPGYLAIATWETGLRFPLLAWGSTLSALIGTGLFLALAVSLRPRQ